MLCHCFLSATLCCISCIVVLHPPTFTLFPYTTLFRSRDDDLRRRHSRRVSPLPVHPPVVELTNATVLLGDARVLDGEGTDRKSTRLNSSHRTISYAGFCLKKKILAVLALKHSSSLYYS